MPGTLDELSCVSPTPTTSSSGAGDGLHDARDYNGRSWSRHSRSSSALDRHSESSESLDNHSTSSGTGGRPMHDFGSSEYIPTRSSKVSPKVAYNPMQFVKTGPAKLVNSAHEQLRKAEEVKKIREVRKDDAEDWQSNLEGWKSNRRKRQEHVIERVTEVKRMEQEEALKASEAAAKRLMGIREKRGKLSALYSVEDDNEITFDVAESSESVTSASSTTISSSTTTTTTTTASSSSSTVTVVNEEIQEKREETSETTIVTTSTTKSALSAVEEEKTRAPESTAAGQRPDSQEYTYDKAIEQYVKYSTTALSKQEVQHSETKTSSSPTSGDVAVVRRPVGKTPALDSSEARPCESAASAKPGTSEELVKKRAIFERESSAEQAPEDPNSSRASAIAAANRRSGEFSSTFKSRLSTFQAPESPSSQPAAKATPDPQFKSKLATFHRAASETGDEARNRTPVALAGEETEKPDFKAKLAAFRQVEKAATEPAKPAPKPKPVHLVKQEPKPDVPLMEPPLVKPPLEPANNIKQMTMREEPVQAVEEPIYANSSVYDHGKDESAGDAESSDCTEDEGIRSLSPHGTPSPTSPTRTEPAEQLSSFHAFHAQQQQQQQQQQPSPPSETPPPPPVHTADTRWSQSEVVWHDWVVDLPPAAPPNEKPPPPPLDDDLPVTTPSTPTAPSPVASDAAEPESTSFAPHQVAARREADSDARKELRKRRSDFLGFDVGAAENDAQQLADAIPPPPDLKTLLRSTSDYRSAPSSTKTVDEDSLARKEREIIETLEKEERLKGVSSPYSTHDTSSEGVEFEMTAEIDQLAREWRNDAVLGPGWRASAKIQPFPPVEEPKQTRPGVQQPLQVEVNSPRVEQASTASPKQAPSPPKPSRLSAAPKPRLHDGEAWMAKRKVASEGGQKKDAKDVSRHWLIQEAEQRRIDAMQERNYSPSSGSAASPVRPGPASSGSVSIDGNAWMSRSSSSASVDKMSELRLPKDQSRSASSLGSSPTPRPLYANQEEILEYADFTGAPHNAPPVWQVRSIVSSSSMDQLSSIHSVQPPVRPAKMTQSKSQTLPVAGAPPVQNPAQTQPSWRSTHPPETEKEPIQPLPHSVIHTLTQRVSQRSANNYGDYMNVQEVAAPSTVSRAGPQVPAQRPSNYRHPSLGQSSSAPMTSTAVQPPVLPPNNSDRMLSVSGKKKCSLCQAELGRGAAMIIESLRLFYHINCFRCCVCGIALGNGTAGTDVRVRNNNLHCHDCYSNDDGLKFSKV